MFCSSHIVMETCLQVTHPSLLPTPTPTTCEPLHLFQAYSNLPDPVAGMGLSPDALGESSQL